MLDGEQEWLTALIANLADDTAKLVYADWLQEQNDDRAAFLRQYVAAAQTMKADDFPKPKKKYSEEWLELIGFRFLHGLAQQELAELKEPVLRLARPALRMQQKPTKDTKLAVGASKLGGLPDLPASYAWPLGKECHAGYDEGTKGVEQLAGFLAQVNLAEVSHTQATRDLPRVGLLSFFSFQDIENDKPGVIGAKAVFFPNPTGFVRTQPPGELVEGNKVLPTSQLSFEETLDLPEAGRWNDGPWQRELSLASGDDVMVVEEYRLKNFKNMFGYGRSTTGGDPTPSTEFRHLILLENSVGCRLHIQISKQSLTALNFDNIKLVWVDFD